MATEATAVIDDLAAEHAAVELVVRDLDLCLPTLAQGWSVADTVHHLLVGDRSALMTLSEPERFEEHRSRRGQEPAPPADEPRAAELLTAWRVTHDAVVDAARQADPSVRVAWYGPSMSLRSFVSARLMEYWAHGEDIAQAAHLHLPATHRPRNVCHLGVATREFSFTVRGDVPPATPVSVRLRGPADESWAWGDEDAPESIIGPARDFCLVVTQRRHVEDTELQVQGAGATAWMHQAQAFAGAPTSTETGRRGVRH